MKQARYTDDGGVERVRPEQAALIFDPDGGITVLLPKDTEGKHVNEAEVPRGVWLAMLCALLVGDGPESEELMEHAEEIMERTR